MYVRYTHSSVVKFENFEPAFFEGNRNLNKPQPNSPYRIFFYSFSILDFVAHDKPCYWGDKNQGWCEDCWTRIPLQRWFNFQTVVPPPLSHVHCTSRCWENYTWHSPVTQASGRQGQGGLGSNPGGDKNSI